VGDAVGNYLNGKALRIADRLISGVSIAHYAWQFHRLCDPTPVFLPIKFDRQLHPFITRLVASPAHRSPHARTNLPRPPNNIHHPTPKNAVGPC
jgi:hypothetical protein